MTGKAASMFVEALAINTRVMGMVAENMQRQYTGNAMAYGEEAFEAHARGLVRLATWLNQEAQQ